MEPQTKLDPLTETALRSLKDISVPPPVSWMPQTWGWLVVATVLVAAILVWVALAYRRWRRNAYRREALRLLDVLANDLRNPQTHPGGTALLAELLKRTALAAWPREAVAAASGPDWTSFLDAHQDDDIGGALKSYLDDLEYQNRRSLAGDETDQLVREARRWIESHHVST